MAKDFYISMKRIVFTIITALVLIFISQLIIGVIRVSYNAFLVQTAISNGIESIYGTTEVRLVFLVLAIVSQLFLVGIGY